MLSTQIEIAASPASVRAKFLNFSLIPVYSPNGFIKQVKPEDPDKPIEEGDRLDNVIGGTHLRAFVLENSPETFRWRGNFHNMLIAEHIFRFLPSRTTPGATTFIQEEEFSGPLAFITRQNWVAKLIGMRAQTQKFFESFNLDLKRACEL